jgi:hypothetical protein
MSIEIPGSTLRPNPVSVAQVLPNTGPVPRDGNYPFTAIHHHEWEFVRGAHVNPGGEWLPKISEARHVPGGNGSGGVQIGDAAGTRGTGEAPRMVARIGNMLAGIRSKRSIVIEHFDHRLGKYGTYLKAFPTATGAQFYCYDWVHAILVNNGRDVVFECDEVESVGFRRQVLAGGIIQPMPRQALNSEVAVIRNKIGRWGDKMAAAQMDRDAYEAAVKDAQAEIAAMTAAWEYQFGANAGVARLAPAPVAPSVTTAQPLDDSDIVAGEAQSPDEPIVAPRKRKAA